MGNKADWPAAAEILNAPGTSDIILLCEHASNHIPAEYNGLGLSKHDLKGHIAWDPGAADVTRQLSGLLDAPAYLGTYSRLLIDLNRPLESQESIVARSEDTDIPGNGAIDAAEAKRRAERIFWPFHHHVSDVLDRRQKAGRPTRLVSIHSFTPVFLGETRPWHVGVLFDQAKAFGQGLATRLQRPGLLIGENAPYQAGRTEDYAIPVHGDDRGIPAVLLEIRQDLIKDDKGVSQWASRLFQALALMCSPKIESI